MDGRQAIRELIKDSPAWSQNRLAAEVGMSGQAMSNRMQRQGDLRCDFAARLLAVLGYDLVAVPRGSRLPNGSVRIDGRA